MNCRIQGGNVLGFITTSELSEKQEAIKVVIVNIEQNIVAALMWNFEFIPIKGLPIIPDLSKHWPNTLNL